MNTTKIHIRGRVQGVGFRPFVKQLADAAGLNGWVKNTASGVEILLKGGSKDIDHYLEKLQHTAPPAAIIGGLEREQLSSEEMANGFHILPSSIGEEPSVNLTPDLAICATCKQELHDQTDRRHAYAFTTCTNCGPRYSIIEALPYDRERTHMHVFEMCSDCAQEYQTLDDRRFHSQTNSCQQCGVHLKWLDQNSHQGDPIAETLHRLRSGQIIAAKGMGGFLLLADASNDQTIQTLRERKSRPAKPFACLYPDLGSVQADCRLSSEEQEALLSRVAPIVLLQVKSESSSVLAFDDIAPGLDRLGVMLPSNALLELIASGFGKPLVATSGNVSGAPICYTNDQARNHLSGIADAILGHDLRITTPLDDSVLRFTTTGKRIILRRARGLAPEVLLPLRFKDRSLALGAEMKSAFALATGKQLLLSQALGDTSSYDAQRMYKHSLDHLLGLMNVDVDTVICDQHPDYFTSQWAMQWKDDRGVVLKRIQHHKAHLAALLYESSLEHTSSPILGVVWDGTGYGEDGNIWGGEFFLVQGAQMERVGHLAYAPVMANHRMMKEPPVALLALSGERGWVDHLIPAADADLLERFYQSSRLQTSSMGRLFDAVAACLMGIKKNRYEGEAAMRLEQLAAAASQTQWRPFEIDYSAVNLSVKDLLHAIHQEKGHADAQSLALRFHQSLVEWIRVQARLLEVGRLAFSGGVFQNALLIELIEAQLAAEFKLHFHQQLPPNDESVALGQLVYSAYFESNTNPSTKTKRHVLSRSR